MTQRMLAVAVLAGLFWTVPLLAQVPAGAAAYRVTIVVYPGDDPAAVARRLAAMYRGTLETPVDSNGSFTISLSDSGAGLMRRDPIVATMDAPSLAPSVPPSVAPLGDAAVAAAPGTVQANATTSWSLGPYRYDGSGNIRAVGSDFYAYDKLGRVVVSADAPPSMPVVHKQTYTYDPYGNLRSISTAGRPATTLEMAGASNRLASVSNGSVSVPVGYDGAGNFVSYLGATYEYDALNVLWKSVAGGVTRSYVYTANDERIGTVEETASGVRSDWTIRDSEGRVLRRFSKESTGDWNWQEDYIYRGSQMLAAEVPDSAKTRHFHLDHLGTPRLITGNGGAEISRHTYHPFGEEIASSAGTREKKQFTGHERDSESLDYMHARFYAPFMGRFLSVDPEMNPEKIKYEPQQWNRYSYVTNNPLKYTDPDGKDKFMAWLLGDAFRDVSTWDALKGALSPGAAVTAMNEGRDQFHEAHQQMFRGYSPYPANTTDQVLLPVMMMLGPAGKGVARTTLVEAKTLIGKWAVDPVKNTIAGSLRYHFKAHGAEVGARNLLQYLRSASEFTRNLKGATRHVLDDGKIRYIKNNRYVILDQEGKIVSYGAVRQ